MTTEERINDLEQRLEYYHYALVEAIHQRDRLALDAAWGVHLGLYSLAGAAASIYLTRTYFSDLGWLGQTLIGLGFIAVMGAINMWSNDARMKEIDRLPKLPEWRRRWSAGNGVED